MKKQPMMTATATSGRSTDFSTIAQKLRQDAPLCIDETAFDIEACISTTEAQAHRYLDAHHLVLPEDWVKMNSYSIANLIREEARCQSCTHTSDQVMRCGGYYQAIEMDDDAPRIVSKPCPYLKATRLKQQYERIMGKMFVGKKFRNRTFETFQPSLKTERILAFCKDWVQSYQPGKKGLYIFGGFGSGKTHLAIATLLALQKQYDTPCLFMTMASFLDSIKASFNKDHADENLFELFVKAPVLVIDDLGEGRTEKNGMLSSWAQERLFVLINARYEQELTTIVTSKYNPRELASVVGMAVASRLAEMCYFLHDREGDYRFREITVIE